MPERMMTHRQLEELKEFMEDVSDALQFRSHASSYFWPLLRAALALRNRVDAFKEWAGEYLVALGESREATAQFCKATGLSFEPELPEDNLFLGRLVALMEGGDADET